MQEVQPFEVGQGDRAASVGDRLDRVESLLLQVIALLTDEGVEDEEAEEMVEIVTMDGHRHQVARSPSIGMSPPRGEGQKSGGVSS